jgi:hypothetical protein
MVPGGKDPRTSLACEFLQAGKTLLKETLAPLTHDLARGIEALGDLVVAQSLRSVENDLGTDHVPI